MKFTYLFFTSAIINVAGTTIRPTMAATKINIDTQKAPLTIPPLTKVCLTEALTFNPWVG